MLYLFLSKQRDTLVPLSHLKYLLNHKMSLCSVCSYKSTAMESAPQCTHFTYLWSHTWSRRVRYVMVAGEYVKCLACGVLQIMWHDISQQYLKRVNIHVGTITIYPQTYPYIFHLCIKATKGYLMRWVYDKATAHIYYSYVRTHDHTCGAAPSVSILCGWYLFILCQEICLTIEPLPLTRTIHYCQVLFALCWTCVPGNALDTVKWP